MLPRLEAGKLLMLITQNIDGLHSAAALSPRRTAPGMNFRHSGFVIDSDFDISHFVISTPLVHPPLPSHCWPRKGVLLTSSSTVAKPITTANPVSPCAWTAKSPKFSRAQLMPPSHSRVLPRSPPAAETERCANRQVSPSRFHPFPPSHFPTFSPACPCR